ncbi:MAG: hypothetical protein ACOX50_04895 [Patescibacteria group bacterium]|jgi:hypothetical protein
MRKVAFSLFMAAMAGLLTIGATQAVFSDTGFIVGNTIASGSVDLTVHNFSGNKPINSQLLVPGEFTEWGRAELFNTGNLPVKVYMYVDELSGNACGFTNLQVATGFAGGNEMERDIYNGPLDELIGEENRVEVTGIPPFDVLDPNITQVIQQRAQLVPEADNSAQGESCTWREVFVAESIAL